MSLKYAGRQSQDEILARFTFILCSTLCCKEPVHQFYEQPLQHNEFVFSFDLSQFYSY